jgi:hypothetical protein
MEYGIDFYNEQNYNSENIITPGFIYDNRRLCSKLYVFLKLLGLIFYTTTLSTCYRPYFHIIMFIAMFVSTMNSMFYEYQHYKRYKTNFSSISEFKLWKKNMWPKSRNILSSIEIGIKIWFFIKTFPPQFEFKNLCDLGESIFKIHILLLFSLYGIVGIFTIFLLFSFYCYDSLFIQQNQSLAVINKNITLPIQILVIDNKNEECSICLDNDSTKTWTILPCCHKFHASCVSTWLLTHQTCPICRSNIISNLL